MDRKRLPARSFPTESRDVSLHVCRSGLPPRLRVGGDRSCSRDIIVLLKSIIKIQEGHSTERTIRMATFVAWLAMASFLIPAHGQIAPPDERKINDLYPPPPSEAENAGRGLDIYVDGSMSMRGYVTSSGSNYCQTVRTVVESATVGRFDLRIYKFASDISTITSFPLNQMQSPVFYNGRDTPLAAILNRLALAPTRSAIIITDLVQSQTGTDSLVLAQALGHLASQVHEIKLLAYRSTFEGSYYPESQHGPAIHLANTQSLPDAGRPFYLLVVAPDAPSMKKLDSYLLSRVPPAEMIHPTEPAVSVETINLAPHKSGALPWALYKQPSRKESRILRITSAFHLTRATGPQEILPLEVRMRAGIPIRNPAQLSYETTRFTWQGPGHTEQVSQVDLPVSGTSGTGESIAMKLTLHRPESGTWDIYMIKMRPGPGNLDVPQWVNAWSTNDDTTAINGNRTFQLKLIAQAMLNSITENSVFLEYVLEVGR